MILPPMPAESGAASSVKSPPAAGAATDAPAEGAGFASVLQSAVVSAAEAGSGEALEAQQLELSQEQALTPEVLTPEEDVLGQLVEGVVQELAPQEAAIDPARSGNEKSVASEGELLAAAALASDELAPARPSAASDSVAPLSTSVAARPVDALVRAAPQSQPGDVADADDGPLAELDVGGARSLQSGEERGGDSAGRGGAGDPNTALAAAQAQDDGALPPGAASSASLASAVEASANANASAARAAPLEALAAVERATGVQTPEQTAAARAISQRVEVLASQGGGVARIRLNPPELGQVELSVRVRGDAVEIVMRVEEQAVQLAAHSARERLVENLATRDLRIENFEISSFDGRSEASLRDGASSMQQEAREQASEDARANRESAESGAPGELAVQARVTTISTQVVDIRV